MESAEILLGGTLKSRWGMLSLYEGTCLPALPLQFKYWLYPLDTDYSTIQALNLVSIVLLCHKPKKQNKLGIQLCYMIQMGKSLSAVILHKTLFNKVSLCNGSTTTIRMTFCRIARVFNDSQGLLRVHQFYPF